MKDADLYSPSEAYIPLFFTLAEGMQRDGVKRPVVALARARRSSVLLFSDHLTTRDPTRSSQAS